LPLLCSLLLPRGLFAVRDLWRQKRKERGTDLFVSFQSCPKFGINKSIAFFLGDNRSPAGERIVESFGRGLSDYVIGIGPVFCYEAFVTDKGNKIFLQFSGSSETRVTETGFKRGTYRGAALFVGGTGQFLTIRGYLVQKAKYDTDPKTGYNLGEFRGQYWFEQ
jgi:hypothetical protein